MKHSALIGRVIAECAPHIKYTDKDLREAENEFTKSDIEEMKSLGLMKDSFEEFYVIREFISRLPFSDELDGEYISDIFFNAKMLDGDEFMSDPYIKNVNFKDTKKGDILLTYASYMKGEIFQYDMPVITKDKVIPRLGFFNKAVRFPALYEGVVPWVSVCPSEINSMKNDIEAAHGRVLVLGLGLGYYPFIASASEKVERITIVEINKKTADIFEETILPCFPEKEKIKVIVADAVEYMKTVSEDDFDFCFADIWEGAVDGAPLYLKIKAHEKRLSKTEFTYWIKNEIEEYLSEK
ncbi:MAG: hypothetical protein E7665_01945 [Ruminococcaceae bacterium]|nr:hypothetical protein [Oscillospiraceae bacterium]